MAISASCTANRKCLDWITLHMSRHMQMNSSSGDREIVVQHYGYIHYRDILCEWFTEDEVRELLIEVSNDDDWELISEPNIQEIFEGADRFNVDVKLRKFSLSAA